MLDPASIPPARRSDLVVTALGDNGRYVVKDPRTTEYYTFGEQEHFLLMQLDGKRAAHTICAAFAERFNAELSVGDLEGFLALARSQRLLQSEAPRSPKSAAAGLSAQSSRSVDSAGGEGVAEPSAASASDASLPLPRRRQSVLYWRKNLFDPDRLFDFLEPKLRFLWTPTFLVLSMGSILLAVVLAWANRHELVSYFPHSLRWETLALVWIALLAVATCHEFAHGLTCKHYGGEVHELGFLMMFFMPCFYCNVSDAWLFREKSKRLWVTLAGGYFEMFLWALALILWRLTAQDSLPNYLAWIVISVSGVRWLFNFNPLLKFDGYYLLSDLLEVPNLRSRAIGYLMRHFQWLFWGAKRPDRDARSKLLLGFGAASWLFSLVLVSFLVVMFGRFVGGGLGLAVAALLGMMVMPGLFHGILGGEIKNMLLHRHKRKALWLAALAVVLAILCLVPMAERGAGTFHISSPVKADLRAPVAGFLEAVYFDEGERVPAGAEVARLAVPELASRTVQKRRTMEEVAAELQLLQAGPRREELSDQRARIVRAEGACQLARHQLAQAKVALTASLTELDELRRSAKPSGLTPRPPTSVPGSSAGRARCRRLSIWL